VAGPEDEDAGLDLFGREQAKAAGLPPEFHLCGGRGGDSNIEDQGERTDGDNDREQDGSGAERLAAGDIEVGAVSGRRSSGFPGASRIGGGPAGLVTLTV
jgi:hypothetical protein